MSWGKQDQFKQSSPLNYKFFTKIKHLIFYLGLFSNNHMPYHHEVRDSKYDIPTLKEMTQSAIKLLKKGPHGFFLLAS